LLDVDAAADSEDKLAILTQIVTNAFPLDLVTTWLAESQALVETKKKQTIIPPTSSAPTTSTKVSNLPASSATVLTNPSVKSESEDENNDSRRYKAYKLPPNVPMFMADGRTCDEWFFVFENALNSNSIPFHVVLPIVSTFLKILHLLKILWTLETQIGQLSKHCYERHFFRKIMIIVCVFKSLSLLNIMIQSIHIIVNFLLSQPSSLD
jgi:hypothetical protein